MKGKGRFQKDVGCKFNVALHNSDRPAVESAGSVSVTVTPIETQSADTIICKEHGSSIPGICLEVTGLAALSGRSTVRAALLLEIYIRYSECLERLSNRQ
jgi:hypothetical protein